MYIDPVPLLCFRCPLAVLKPTLPLYNMAPIQITVFTGFLGAGKTSIILSLLPQLPKDYKVVLLKNEFGDVEGEQSNHKVEALRRPMHRTRKCTASSRDSQPSRPSTRSSMDACTRNTPPV